MANNHFYLTTTLPYVNAEPHIGFGLEITEADVISRYQRLLGKQVIFNTGTDEHGQKIYNQALQNHLSPQEYCDQYAAKFHDLKTQLNLSYDHFIRTTDSHHISAAQEFWQRCASHGDIYKKLYKIKYCVGCEMEKTDSELVNTRCPLHPNQELEIREEENYFFAFSKYQQALLEFYQKNPNFVKPVGKFREIISFIQAGPKDFSISRLKNKMPWGIDVPGDNEQVMYVWFDALINYISTLGWPNDLEQFNNYWPGVQLAGKDNLRQQAAMWQAMLMSADLPNSQQILINGFIGINGQKMSKSLGNVIAPQDLVSKYGVDAARYLLINLGVFAEDMDVTWEKLDTTYQANLANGLGNLCSRVAKLALKIDLNYQGKATEFSDSYQKLMNNYELTQALQSIFQTVKEVDIFLSDSKPWLLEGQEKETSLKQAIDKIREIAFHLQPFMPDISAQILETFTGQIKAILPLFPRIDR